MAADEFLRARPNMNVNEEIKHKEVI